MKIMSEVFSDQLIDAIEAKGAPICVGIDPIFEMLPDAVAGDPAKRNANDREAAIDAIFAFTTSVLRTIAPLVPIVKFQSAYFEQYLWEGVEAYYSLLAEAKELGLLAKRLAEAKNHAEAARTREQLTRGFYGI